MIRSHDTLPIKELDPNVVINPHFWYLKFISYPHWRHLSCLLDSSSCPIIVDTLDSLLVAFIDYLSDLMDIVHVPLMNNLGNYLNPLSIIICLVDWLGLLYAGDNMDDLGWLCGYVVYPYYWCIT